MSPCLLVSLSESDLAQRCTQLLAEAEIWVERSRPRPRRFNLRPYVSQLRYVPPFLEMGLWVTPNGAARPEELAQLLGLAPLLEHGAYFERTSLELCDEVAKDDPEIIPPCLLERPGAPGAQSVVQHVRHRPENLALGDVDSPLGS